MSRVGARPASDFDGQTCTAPAARTLRMAEIVSRHAGAERPLRVLDLGCGTGTLAFRLADALPAAHLTGLDISAANIREAEAARRAHPAGDRIRFVQADYLEFADEPFDLIVTDGVLHLVPADTSRLVRKLAADARAGGTLVICMPRQCAYNRAFAVLRRLLRATRTAAVDRLILAAGRRLHPEASEAMLAERVHYIYRPPERVMGAALAREFEASGWRREATYSMPSISLAQLRHSVTVWRKGS